MRFAQLGNQHDEFQALVSDWLATARHRRFDRPYTELTYAPMKELLACLRANGFKVHIVSGGGVEFMRVSSERVYGVSPEQAGRQHEGGLAEGLRPAGPRRMALRPRRLVTPRPSGDRGTSAAGPSC